MSKWRDNLNDPLSGQCRGKTVIIRLVNPYDGITHNDEDTGEEYTVDLSWMRSSSGVHATSGTYDYNQIDAWKDI